MDAHLEDLFGFSFSTSIATQTSSGILCCGMEEDKGKIRGFGWNGEETGKSYSVSR